MSRKPLGLVLAVLLVWLVAYPIGLVLIESVGGPGEWTLDYIKEFVRDSFEWSALWGSVWISVASVALAGAIGVPVGFFFENQEDGSRSINRVISRMDFRTAPASSSGSCRTAGSCAGFRRHLDRWRYAHHL